MSTTIHSGSFFSTGNPMESASARESGRSAIWAKDLSCPPTLNVHQPSILKLLWAFSYSAVRFTASWLIAKFSLWVPVLTSVDKAPCFLE